MTSKTRVMVLMHPDERRRRIATGRMAHLCLPNSALVVGESFALDPTVAREIDAGDSYLLYPGIEAQNCATLERSPRCVFVLDGKWTQSRKMLRNSPNLAALPRLSFRTAYNSLFTIKRQPKEYCLSTIEAIACLLAHLPGGAKPEILKLLVPFFHMVNQQLEFENYRRLTGRVF